MEDDGLDFINADGGELDFIDMEDEIVLLAETSGGLTVDGGISGTDYDLTDTLLTVKTNTPITVSVTTTTSRIFVNSTNGANITLSGVNITSTASAIEIRAGNGDVTVTLNGSNMLTSDQGFAGLQKTDVNCMLTINGSGSLEAKGGNNGGAGIGGGSSMGMNPQNKEFGIGEVTITGGNINAIGSIGNGIPNDGSGGKVEISGSDTVIKIEGVKGIYSNELTISDGNITAMAADGAGLSCTNITINGGEVAAKGQASGTGSHPAINGSNITINGGKVTAEPKSWVKGIEGTDITITGGTVEAIPTGYGDTGIYGTNVKIEGTSSTSYPWVVTNKIYSRNDHSDDYHGVVFDENHKNYVYPKNCTNEDEKKVRGEHKPDGIVYGDVILTEDYP